MADFTTSKVDGNTVDASEWNQLADLDNAVISSGQTPSTGNLNQTGIAMAINAAGADFYSDSGTANAYVLTAIGTLRSPHAYFDGMRVRFRPDNANTGASTVNVATLGVKSIKRSDGTTATSAGDIPANADIELRYDLANGVFIVVKARSATESLEGLALLPSNIVIANNTTDANNDIDFTGGVFQFSDGSGQAVVAALIKRLDASWVAGTNQGGLDTGTKANSTWYYCYAIYNPTTLVADFLFSASPTSPTLPSGFTKSFRIKGAFVKTNSSGNIIPFYHLGRTWTNRTTDYADQVLVAAVSQTGSTATLSSAFPALVNRAMTEIELGLTSVGNSSFSVWGNLQSQTGTGDVGNVTGLRGTSITTNNGFGVSGIGQIFNDNGVLSYRNWEFSGGVSAIKVFLISIEDLTK
jgi:hypothetical protein